LVHPFIFGPHTFDLEQRLDLILDRVLK
jgi:hypothetical protein